MSIYICIEGMSKIAYNVHTQQSYIAHDDMKDNTNKQWVGKFMKDKTINQIKKKGFTKKP